MCVIYRLHDLNDDNLLDGLEMMAALRHAYDHHDSATSKLREMSGDSRGDYLMKYYTSEYTSQCDDGCVYHGHLEGRIRLTGHPPLTTQ